MLGMYGICVPVFVCVMICYVLSTNRHREMTYDICWEYVWSMSWLVQFYHKQARFGTHILGVLRHTPYPCIWIPTIDVL